MLPLHQRPARLRVMIVRPMRLPDRGFITTEAGRDSNGSVFTECGNLDFLPVLKHRDSGIGVVPVVRVSLTVASSRRGEMESYTVSARV